MATLYITEFSELGFDLLSNTLQNVPLTPPIAEQNVAITNSSVQSHAFNANTRLVLLATDTACFLAWGAAPVAVSTAHYFPANTTRLYGVIPGQKVAVII